MSRGNSTPYEVILVVDGRPDDTVFVLVRTGDLEEAKQKLHEMWSAAEQTEVLEIQHGTDVSYVKTERIIYMGTRTSAASKNTNVPSYRQT